MFIYQGQKAFYLWNKVNPEIDQKLIELLLSKLNEKIGITGSLLLEKQLLVNFYHTKEDLFSAPIMLLRNFTEVIHLRIK